MTQLRLSTPRRPDALGDGPWSPPFPRRPRLGRSLLGAGRQAGGDGGSGRNPANSELCNRCNSHFVAGNIQSASTLALKLPDELPLEGAPHSASVLAACSTPWGPGSGVLGERLQRITVMKMPPR